MGPDATLPARAMGTPALDLPEAPMSGRPDPSELDRIVLASDPQMQPVVQRLIELESAAFLSPLQMYELNDLRKEVSMETGIALAQAFML